jgi:hypothetical protein
LIGWAKWVASLAVDDPIREHWTLPIAAGFLAGYRVGQGLREV